LPPPVRPGSESENKGNLSIYPTSIIQKIAAVNILLISNRTVFIHAGEAME
jgi:hypothetical protein